MRRRRGSAGRRLATITIDQAVAGGSNVLTGILAARLLDVGSFGRFGLIFVLYTLLVSATRALVSEPLLVHPAEADERPGEVIAAGSLLGLGVAVLTVVVGIGVRVIDPQMGTAMFALAACLPLLVLQDAGRYIGFATHRPSQALVLDTVWLVLVVGLAAVLIGLGVHTLAWFVVVWAGSGAASGLLVFWQHPTGWMLPSLKWVRYTWSFSWRYLMAYGFSQGGVLAMSSAVGGIAGTRSLGAFQGTILLIRPFGTMQIAAVSAGVAEISRTTDPGRVRSIAVKSSVLTTAVAAANGGILLLLPDRVGRVLLGATWEVVKPLLLASALQITVRALLTGARAGLLGLRLIQRAMRLDVVFSVLLLGATIGGAAVDGVQGAVWGGLVVHTLASIVWWVEFHRSLGSTAGHTSGTGAAPPVEAALAIDESVSLDRQNRGA